MNKVCGCMHLSVDGIEFSYGHTPVLKGVGIELDRPEILGILGPNGSGKTTLIRCINGILEPHQGSIALDEVDVSEMSRKDVARNLGYVPQNASTESASPEVFDVVLMGRRPHVVWEFSKRDHEIVWEAMREMGVENLATQEFGRLSSGQAQRVLMARAIAQEAKVLLLDEPTSNLDVKYQMEVMETVRRLVTEKSIGVCAIIHDLDLAMRFCDRVVLMSDGHIVAAGPTTEVITPENIRKVYEVDAVIEHMHGRPRVVIL